VAYLCSNRGKQECLHHLGNGQILLGENAHIFITWTEEIAACFRRTGSECRVVPDLKSARWEKLVCNIRFNGLCALMIKPVDILFYFEHTRCLVREIMDEVITTANAQSLLKPIPLTLPEKMVASSFKLGQNKPLMLIDKLEGRPLELGALLVFRFG
jgi:2-dehydropantoate 2-reductase